MTTITINKKQFHIPSSWRELSRRQILAVAPLLLGSIDTLAIRRAIVLFYFIPQARKYWTRHALVASLMKRFPAIERCYPIMTEAQKWELLSCVNFLFNEISGVTILHAFRHDDVTYY